MGRPARPMYARKTTIYLTKPQKNDIRLIQGTIEETRHVELESITDTIGYAVTELRKTLQKELATK